MEIRSGVIEPLTAVRLARNHASGIGAVAGGGAGLGIGSPIGGGYWPAPAVWGRRGNFP